MVQVMDKSGRNAIGVGGKGNRNPLTFCGGCASSSLLKASKEVVTTESWSVRMLRPFFNVNIAVKKTPPMVSGNHAP